MANQQPRPAWFRFPALGNRPIAPPPTPNPNPTPLQPPVAQPVPIRPPQPMPTITRPIIPAIPIMQPVLPTQTQEPTLPPSTEAPQPLPPVPPSSPMSSLAPDAAAPRSPIVTAAPETTPGRSPITNPVEVATPPKSTIKPSDTAAPPPAQVESPLSSPVVPPAFQPTRPSVPATLLPPQTPPATSPTIAPHATPPVPKAPITASRNVLPSSSPTPASPKVKTKSPSSSMPTSPVSRPVASPAAISATPGHKTATPISSPKTVKPSERTPEQSPKINHLSNAPSPFSLPPTQKTEDESEPKFPAEVEQKKVLVQETTEKPKELTNTLNKRVDSSGRRDHVMNTKGTSKKKSDSEESDMKVITLAGENKGAIMELRPNQRKNQPSGNPQRMSKNKNNYIGSNLDQSSNESGEEGKSNKDGKSSKGMEMQSSQTAVFLNSNVQEVNNSILYNCNNRHNDPGVHISLTKKANGSLQKDHRGKTIH
ncbi:uncharacterized protein [Primulina huaijiensis]|uniref:uncharacterized protein n=1 Tax=Primulina huaijiensis TaxID=1492673 RepID=UPI003CC7410E